MRKYVLPVVGIVAWIVVNLIWMWSLTGRPLPPPKVETEYQDVTVSTNLIEGATAYVMISTISINSLYYWDVKKQEKNKALRIDSDGDIFIDGMWVAENWDMAKKLKSYRIKNVVFYKEPKK